MNLTVEQITSTEKEGKPLIHKITMKGTDASLVEMTVTLSSEFKHDLTKYVPLTCGEQRNVVFELVNRTLDEYAAEEEMRRDEKHAEVVKQGE